MSMKIELYLPAHTKNDMNGSTRGLSPVLGVAYGHIGIVLAPMQ